MIFLPWILSLFSFFLFPLKTLFFTIFSTFSYFLLFQCDPSLLGVEKKVFLYWIKELKGIFKDLGNKSLEFLEIGSSFEHKIRIFMFLYGSIFGEIL